MNRKGENEGKEDRLSDAHQGDKVACKKAIFVFRLEEADRVHCLISRWKPLCQCVIKWLSTGLGVEACVYFFQL